MPLLGFRDGRCPSLIQPTYRRCPPGTIWTGPRPSRRRGEVARQQRWQGISVGSDARSRQGRPMVRMHHAPRVGRVQGPGRRGGAAASILPGLQVPPPGELKSSCPARSSCPTAGDRRSLGGRRGHAERRSVMLTSCPGGAFHRLQCNAVRGSHRSLTLTRNRPAWSSAAAGARWRLTCILRVE